MDRLGDAADTATVDLETRVATAADDNRRCLAAVEAVAELDRHRTELALQIEKLTPQRSQAGEQQHAAAAQADQLHEQAAAQLSLPDAHWPSWRSTAKRWRPLGDGRRPRSVASTLPSTAIPRPEPPFGPR